MLLLVALLSGCASITDPYVEPDLPYSQVGTINGYVLRIPPFYYRRVDIGTVDGKNTPSKNFLCGAERYKLLPGVHRVSFMFRELLLGVKTEAIEWVPLYFKADAGKQYDVDYQRSGAQITCRIIDRSTGAPVQLLKPVKKPSQPATPAPPDKTSVPDSPAVPEKPKVPDGQ